MAVTLQRILEETSSYLGETVGQETYLWRDLKMWGDDFDLGFLAAIKERIPEFTAVTAPLHLYLPLEGEVGIFGTLITSREIPDLTMRELFAFMEFTDLPPEHDRA